MKRSTKGKRRKRSRLSIEERQKRAAERKYRNHISTAFERAGFLRILSRDIPVEVGDRRTDIDAIYCHENVLVLVEDTMSTGGGLADHVRKTSEWCAHARECGEELIDVLCERIPDVQAYVEGNGKYNRSELHVVFVYAHRYHLEDRYRTRYAKTLRFLSYAELQYFRNLSSTIGHSARFELLKFLGLELELIGPPRGARETTTYEGLLLSESPSGFPQGHKIVSFLADPHSLLERAYVLRAESWRDSECLYQRLLVKAKISGMREYLSTSGRVFVNNIIVTLPADTELKDAPGRSHRGAHLKPIEVTLPRRFNTIGVIDGQHRVFAYHEGTDKAEKKIAILREKQHLLVTGIIYPPHLSERKREQFEAKLFLEINDKQTPVRSDLKQSIERMLYPFSAVAIAKAVVERLGASGPLEDLLEVHFFDTGKIKTASIVSYGLRHIVRTDGDHSFTKVWSGTKKSLDDEDLDALASYVRYCSNQLNLFFNAFRRAVGEELWVADRAVSRALTTTTINGLVYCMRRLLEDDKVGDFDYYADGFARMRIDFRPDGFGYKSSHWKALGTDLYEQCFE